MYLVKSSAEMSDSNAPHIEQEHKDDGGGYGVTINGVANLIDLTSGLQ